MKNMTKQLLIAAAASLAISASAQSKVDFAKDIQPILQKSCFECHGAEKQKGKLRLDSKDAAFKGGESGPALVAGKADKSDLYRRITLPAGHDDIMPSKGDPLTKAQTDLIKAWIDQGADWPAGTGTAAKPAEAEPKPVVIKPSAAELKSIAELEKLGADVRVIAVNSSLREVNFRALGEKTTDASLVPLKNLLTMYELNLAGTKISNAGLLSIAGLPNLQRLHLEKTPVTDGALIFLKDLKKLEYLNLYGTGVTDAGLDHLKGLANLKHLYLFETKVTEAGAKKLQAALPKVQIDRGWDISTLIKPEEKKTDEKKADGTAEKKEAPKAAEKKKKKK
jgi:mono/diheme cytochrome c family protein